MQGVATPENTLTHIQECPLTIISLLSHNLLFLLQGQPGAVVSDINGDQEASPSAHLFPTQGHGQEILFWMFSYGCYFAEETHVNTGRTSKLHTERPCPPQRRTMHAGITLLPSSLPGSMQGTAGPFPPALIHLFVNVLCAPVLI